MPFLCRFVLAFSSSGTISKREECRQVPPPLFLNPLHRAAPSEVPSKEARPPASPRAAKPDAKRALSFRWWAQRTHRTPFSLKQLRCPLCGAAETLNRHSKLQGNDPDTNCGGQVQRGQRVWCSNRGRRGGCGRSVSIFLAEVLPRHTVRAPALWSLLDRLLAGRFAQGGGRGAGSAFCAGDPLPFAASDSPSQEDNPFLQESITPALWFLCRGICSPNRAAWM